MYCNILSILLTNQNLNILKHSFNLKFQSFNLPPAPNQLFAYLYIYKSYFSLFFSNRWSTHRYVFKPPNMEDRRLWSLETTKDDGLPSQFVMPVAECQKAIKRPHPSEVIRQVIPSNMYSFVLKDPYSCEQLVSGRRMA